MIRDMKKKEILKQEFTVSNGFDEASCVQAIKSQLSDKIFKELINAEKHSLILEFKIYVQEQSTEDIDREKLKALKIVQDIQSLTKEQAENPSKFDLMKLWFHSSSIDTSILKKHPIEL